MTALTRIPNGGDAELSPVALQRAAGHMRLSFKTRDDRTVLDDLYQSGCCKVRLPATQAGQLAEAVLINTSGGLTDGDRIVQQVKWGESTVGMVTTQAAERIYKSRAGSATMETSLSVGDGATAFWLPQELIMFDRGRFSRRTEIDLDENARLLAVEQVVFGRSAMGEEVRQGSLRDVWRIRRQGKLIFADNFELSGDIATQLGADPIASGANCLATVIYAGSDAAERLKVMRKGVADVEGDGRVVAAVTCLGPLNIARFVGWDAAALRKELMIFLADFQRSLLRLADGSADMLPRVWMI